MHIPSSLHAKVWKLRIGMRRQHNLSLRMRDPAPIMNQGNHRASLAMSDRKMFSEMDSDSRRFYAKIVNTALSNLYAVEHQLFDTLICESDDPDVMLRWEEAEPLILETIQRRIDADPEDRSWLGL